MANRYANFHNLALESFCYILTKVVWHIMASYFLQPTPLICGLHIIHLIHALTLTTHALPTVNQHAVRQSIPHQDKQPSHIYHAVGLIAYACDIVIPPGHHRGTSLYYPFLLPCSNNGTTSRQHGSTTREDTRNKRRMFALLSDTLQQHRPHKIPTFPSMQSTTLPFVAALMIMSILHLSPWCEEETNRTFTILGIWYTSHDFPKPLYQIKDNLMQPFMFVKSSLVLIIKQAL